MRVPRFLLAKMASTTASGFSAAMQAACGSASTAMSPAAVIRRASSGLSARRAVTSSTRMEPNRIACEKQTVRRMALGRGRSVITIFICA